MAFNFPSTSNIQNSIQSFISSRMDSKLKFSTEPMKGENGMKDWTESMKAVARLPGGIPDYFRLKLWKTLADNHIQSAGINWKEVQNSVFSDRLQENDELIHSQIIKDLHRTGWEGFKEEKKLKQLLLAFARYNKDIGYCQGFNIIGALILQVVDYNVPDALKILLFLIERVIPNGYFDQSLRALSVDMSVLKDLLHNRLPKTMQHLDNLQQSSGNEYEPALTNVFSMHWLLTLFATCLPRKIVYRIWDAVMLEGSEVLLRTALAIWAKISKKILMTSTADQFYELMEKISVQLAEMSDADQDNLITVVYTMAPFPYPGLNELREKYTWNIQPLSTTFRLFQKSVSSILHEETDCDPSVSCSPCQNSSHDSNDNRCKKTDIQQLQAQYRRLLNRQRQASVILKSAFVNAQNKLASNGRNCSFLMNNKSVFNHLKISNSMELTETSKPGSPTLASGAIALQASMIQPASTDIRSSSSPRIGNHRRAMSEDSESPSLKEREQEDRLRKSKALLRSFAGPEE
ncbi:unnamed protein product [Auanema sp. JU1783]|nr:unnamed protein product [Auanema sp. JU1783]